MKATTSSFITEMPVKTSSWEESVLEKRFWAAKQQYNALLGEALKRLRNMREDPRWEGAKVLYKQKSKKTEGKAIFKALETEYRYREYDLYSYCKQWNKKGNFLSIGSRISQKLAKRAFSSLDEYKRGVRGKPRFKGYRGISSIEDNSIDANLKLKNTTIFYLGLKLPLLYDPQDPIHYHGFNSRIKYVRLVRRNFNGRVRYCAQLICEGSPWVKSKNQVKEGVVGLDIGPQTIAIVSPETKEASLRVFADELRENKVLKKGLQRAMVKKLRLGNPTCFEEDRWEKKDKHWRLKQGKPIKGKRMTNRSESLRKISVRLADVSRCEAAYRKTQHGALANQILAQGTTIKTEKLSYKAFQRLFGSSIGLRAPGMFVEILRRKAGNAGGKVEEINTWATKLSQTCHCGKQKKKPLSQRWHRCPCGVEAQRDLYSAYLACFVRENQLIAGQALKAWPGMDIALRTAMSSIKHASSRLLPASLGLSGSERVVHNVS